MSAVLDLLRAAVRANHAAARVDLTVHARHPDHIAAYLSTQQALAAAVSAYELAEPTAAMAMIEEEDA